MQLLHLVHRASCHLRRVSSPCRHLSSSNRRRRRWHPSTRTAKTNKHQAWSSELGAMFWESNTHIPSPSTARSQLTMIWSSLWLEDLYSTDGDGSGGMRAAQLVSSHHHISCKYKRENAYEARGNKCSNCSTLFLPTKPQSTL